MNHASSTRVRLLSGSTLVGMAITLGLAMTPATAEAWGARGHRVAARVAETRLTPDARAGVRALLNEGDTLADIADWADREGHGVVPASAPWHYVNVPITADRYDPRFCSDRGCVVSRIKHYRSILADRGAARRERQLALLFLVHLVEDVHQPLHVGDNHDRGGNQTQVQFLGRGTNLHRLWDTDIINAIKGNDRDWVERLNALITPKNVEEWSRGDVEEWATESLQAARRAYYYPEGARQPLASGSRVGEDYETFARPIIERRLAQAGVRLANELNAAFR
jgi:nuclease S1